MGVTGVLFCTAAGGSYGMGHLSRCLALAEEGADSFRSTLCLLRGEQEALRKVALPPWLTTARHPEEAEDIDLIVSDLRDTNRSDMKSLVQIAPVVAIDDAGEGRRLAAFCIYSLPLASDLSGNCIGLSYLVLSPRIREITPLPWSKKEGVLVSFGGADPEGLTNTAATILNRIGVRPTVIRGPFFTCNMKDVDAEIVEGGIDILDLINRARVLITSFGITMYEALYLGTPVLLINRSRYHEALSKKTPLVSLGYDGEVSLDSVTQMLRKILEEPEKLRKIARQSRSIVDVNGASRIVAVILQAARGCRQDCLFSHRKYRAVKRCEEFSLLRCRRCGDLFLFELRDKGGIYDNEDYFLEDYKQQYGCSYIEDRDTITSMGLERITVIEEIAVSRGRILDVGCAMGFFLDLARSRGWETQGIEISEFASRWARENLSLDVITGSFLNLELPPESYDAVTFFFVAEHLCDLEAMARKTYAILKKGGILCIALPNRGGISFRINKEEYIVHHPRDHYIDTTVRNLARFLKGFGFERRRVRITGIHPERFFKIFGIEKGGNCLDRIYSNLAKIFSLGDTFEVYAVKE
jgi:spore coat polysaccharide biosynthesis predicted glycosyltransferase SpsG/SAM-dependent methyltransferase